jgi:hypothetical protein
MTFQTPALSPIRDSTNWSGNLSGGVMRDPTPLNAFLRLSGIKLPLSPRRSLLAAWPSI